MSLDELKKDWKSNEPALNPIDQDTLQGILKSRAGKQMREPFKYFWMSFVMHILLYALMSHLIIRNWGNTTIQVYSVIGILLYLPFTWVLLKKFKQVAKGQINPKGSLIDNVAFKSEQLRNFFKFKIRYESIQIPFSCALGVVLPFELYMPGGAMSYVTIMVVWFVTALVICFFTIRDENEKRFKRPLRELEAIIGEFRAA